ncbi:MAG: AraC family transcriptional regulator [Clostridiales bacterium]|nr:AraC family transcriptional regulator [Clostridiales bacterium]
MAPEAKLFQNHIVSFLEPVGTPYTCRDLFLRMELPEQCPALVQVCPGQRPQTVPLHWHPGLELLYSRKGEVTVLIDGEAHLLRPGDFLLVGCYALHVLTPKAPAEEYDLLSVSFLPCCLGTDRSAQAVSRDAPGASAAAIAALQALCQQLWEQAEREQEDPAQADAVSETLAAILHRIDEDFCTGERRSSEGNSRLFEALLYLEENFREDLTTKTVSDYFGYSREYFCRLFKRHSNQTFKQYLTELRLNAALSQLRTTDHGVGQIGMDCGFPDEKTFFAAFKRRAGMTPSQYRARLQALSIRGGQ